MPLNGIEAQRIRIVGMCGSLRQESYTRMAVRNVLKGGAELGAETYLIDLADYPLPFCAGMPKETQYPKAVSRLRKEVKRAHGVILGTPEYHGGYSGVLKNALDLMGFEEFQGKIVGLVGVSGGPGGALNALAGLRGVGRALHAWVVPLQASVADAKNAFGSDGQLIDPKLRQRAMNMGQQVARLAFLHHSHKTREFLRLWEEAPFNPGGVH